MFGVVLWSDTQAKSAVIWCEDHGDLAFCSDSMDNEGCALDAGDLIQFDVTVDRHMRLAQNPRRISEGAYMGLADSLRAMPVEDPVPVPMRSRPSSGAEVIPFERPCSKAPAASNALAAR